MALVYFLPGSFLAGQLCVALGLRNPWIEFGLWPCLLLGVPFLRRWDFLAFFLGGFWQFVWAPSAHFSQCHNFFWFLCSANPALDPLPFFFQGGRLDHWAGLFADHSSEVFLNWDPHWGAWFLRFAFGQFAAEGDAWSLVYRQLGLLHVLVVSGSHFSLMGRGVPWLVEGPGRFLYTMRLLSFRCWLGWVTVARMIVTVLITVFALVVGFNPPCQRSWLSVIMKLWLPLLAAPYSARQYDRWVFCLQALCFPNSFLSLSNALSWSAYSMVRALKIWPAAWQRLLLPGVEGPLIAVNLSYFGVFSPYGLLLNPLLQPIWHVVLGLGLLFLLWPQELFGIWLRTLLLGLHRILLFVHQHQQSMNGWIVWEGRGSFGAVCRSLLWGAATWNFLSLWYRPEDRDEAC